MKVILLVSLAFLQQGTVTFAQEINTETKKPVTFTGNVELRGIGYQADGIEARRTPFSYIFAANAELGIYGLALPFAITISEQQRDTRQPFNQFGISPKYKWVQLHAGYRNVTFSPYTLAGYTMLGGGIELTPGKFRFGFMYGRLNKATAIDTTTGLVRPYSFSRMGYAGKIGFGTDEKHFELSYLSAKDDSNSIDKKNIPDSLKTVTPASNSVVALKFAYLIAKHLFIEADGAASVYTYNLGSKMDLKADVDDKINAYTKDFVTFNTSTIGVNATTQVNFAYSGSIGYKAKDWLVKLSYRHIDPEFQSMGAYFFQNDLENYTLGTSINAIKNRIRFTGSIGIQNDNLRKQKTATTSRIIGNANLSADITDKFGIDATYMNFSSNAAPTVVSVNNKYMLAQTTDNISVTPRFVLPKEKFTHVAIASYNLSTLQDHNTETSNYNNINTTVLFVTYSITANKNGLTITAGGNQSKTTFFSGTITTTGGTIGISKPFIRNKLQTSLTGSYSISDQFGNSSIINGGLTASYDITAHHKFSLRYNFLNNIPQTPTITNKTFTEHTGELAYTLTF